MTTEEMGARMSAAEFAEWMAFHSLEPFGGPTEDVRFGTVASAAGALAGIKTAPGEWFGWGRVVPEATGGWQDVMAAFTPFVKR